MVYKMYVFNVMMNFNFNIRIIVHLKKSKIIFFYKLNDLTQLCVMMGYIVHSWLLFNAYPSVFQFELILNQIHASI